MGWAVVSGSASLHQHTPGLKSWSALSLSLKEKTTLVDLLYTLRRRLSVVYLPLGPELTCVLEGLVLPEIGILRVGVYGLVIRWTDGLARGARISGYLREGRRV